MNDCFSACPDSSLLPLYRRLAFPMLLQATMKYDLEGWFPGQAVWEAMELHVS